MVLSKVPTVAEPGRTSPRGSCPVALTERTLAPRIPASGKVTAEMPLCASLALAWSVNEPDAAAFRKRVFVPES